MVTLTVFITCYLGGLTDKLKIYNDSEPKCAQTYKLTWVWIYGRPALCKHIDSDHRQWPRVVFQMPKQAFGSHWGTMISDFISLNELANKISRHKIHCKEKKTSQSFISTHLASTKVTFIKVIKCFNLERMSKTFNSNLLQLIFYFCRSH